MRHGLKAFTTEEATAIRNEYALGRITRPALATRCQVSRPTIDRIIDGLTYLPKPSPKPRLKRFRLTDAAAQRQPGQLTKSRTRTLLRRLGIPAADLAPGVANFWSNHSMTVEHLANQAHQIYRNRIQTLHPDHDGDNAEASALIALWHTLRKRFRRNGVIL